MSDYVKATNFYAKDALLTGNPGKRIKGAEIDAEYNAIATAIATKANLNSPNFTGTPTVPTAPYGTNTTQIASTAFAIANGFPSGGIVLWSGSSASIPSGWYLCNGSNGTPDLRNRFIVGAGDTYAVGAVGGSANAIVVEHTHTGTTNTTGAHTHGLTQIPRNTNIGVRSGLYDQTVNGSGSTYVTDSAGDHRHTFTTDSTGSSGTNANLPPYYALCYIMKA
jgi:hypothetical protein